jgi:hypothetical protein
MAAEKVDFGEAAKAKSDDTGGAKNERSTIAFPYVDLEGAQQVASAIYSRSGLGACEIDELAAEMDQVVSGGAFRLKTAAAKCFGLVDKDGRAAFSLTDLGRQVVETETSGEALAKAFLEVPLYGAVYEKYRGHKLPPPRALEREMELMGVSSKQTSKARQVFERSATQAGFFNAGKDRLVRPKSENPHSGHSAPDSHGEQAPSGASDNYAKAPPTAYGGGRPPIDPPDVDPIIAGLLQRLPAAGANWPDAQRKIWLGLMENSFKLIYSDDDG